MAELRFDWTEKKAADNIQKHGVRFDEAKTVFDDENKLAKFDIKHSEHEDREIVIGLSNRFRLLTVVYTRRNEAIRIINARRSNRAEETRYAEYLHSQKGEGNARRNGVRDARRRKR